MSLFVGIAIAIWLLTLVGWWMASKAFRSADVDRIKSRVLGTPKKKKTSGQQDVALFQKEPGERGQVVLRILQKYNLNEKLQVLIEQAGLKWNVPSLVHGCMGCFIGAYVA
ncbi:MAG: hypothetical protein ACRD7E_11780, partial [Bryobacteraceae bacterium]